MAHIFKYPTRNSKGIVIFTHKEWRVFSGSRIRRVGVEIIQKLIGEVSSDPTGFAKRYIEKISKKYFIGVHFGGYQFRYQLDKIPFKTKCVDFVLSVESTLPNLDPSIHRVPLNCRNFIPASFKNYNREKQWDYVTVGRDVNFKNYPLLFKSIKKVLSIDCTASFLIITPSQKNMKSGAVSALSDVFYSTFSAEEQENIAFLYLHPELEIGMNQKQLIKFYNLAKVFILFSSQIKTRFFEYGEGDSRVISEALCCGLPVVCYSGLKGGGKDFLTNDNSVMFDDFDNAHLSLLDAKNKFQNGIKDSPEQITREDYSLEKLHDYFDELYKINGQEYDRELINVDHLDTRIPAHYFDLPWVIEKNQPTADLKSQKQFDLFMRALKL